MRFTCTAILVSIPINQCTFPFPSLQPSLPLTKGKVGVQSIDDLDERQDRRKGVPALGSNPFVHESRKETRLSRHQPLAGFPTVVCTARQLRQRVDDRPEDVEDKGSGLESGPRHALGVHCMHHLLLENMVAAAAVGDQGVGVLSRSAGRVLLQYSVTTLFL